MNSPPGTPAASGMPAKTAAANPLGIIIDVMVLSKMGAVLGITKRVSTMRPTNSTNVMAKPANSDLMSANSIDIPIYTKKTVLSRNTISPKKIFSVRLS